MNAALQALPSKAGGKACSAFSQCLGLSLRETAHHGHISTDAGNPQAQEQLTVVLVQLQLMPQSLGDMVVNQEIVLKEMKSGHMNDSNNHSHSKRRYHLLKCRIRLGCGLGIAGLKLTGLFASTCDAVNEALAMFAGAAA